jgi:exopolysaccharide/PEP-CTERM locus tyrosine autokinase
MSLVEDALRKQRAARKGGGFAAPPASASEPAPPARQLGDRSRLKRLHPDALRRDGLLPPPSEERLISHQFRTIKRPLIRRAFENTTTTATGASPRSIMVTSALPGDGKTFTSLSLALSLALERDHSVILVDGDVAKPHVSKLFDAGGEPGLLDVLQNPQMTVDSVILPTDIPGLSIVPVGQQSLQATELLASARMRSVIADLEALDPRCVVVVDSPPIMLTSEARVLATLCGQIVLVVRAGGTPQQAVLEAIRLIGEGPEVNVVLNQAVHAGTQDYYGYGTNYGYGADPPEGAGP